MIKVTIARFSAVFVIYALDSPVYLAVF